MPEGVSRREHIVAAAGALFADRGYDRTSMRDIATASGILSGSLYYHFESKQAIYLEAHRTGIALLVKAARKAWEIDGDPWDRLERVAAAHCLILLKHRGLMFLVFPQFVESMASFRPELVKQRDEYEAIIVSALAILDLPPDLDLSLYKLQFLGALNWTQTWYQAERGHTPDQIGRHLVRMLRPR